MSTDRTAIRAKRVSPRRALARDESGSVLILALMVLIVAGGIVASLSGLVMNNLHNTTNFASARSLQYAARSAVNTAVGNIRFTPLISVNQTLLASPPSSCWGPGPVSELTNIDGVPTVAVWCSTTLNPTSAVTRTVTLSACPVTASQSATETDAQLAAACAANPTLQTVVNFDDYPPGVSAPTTAPCFVYCGTSMTVKSLLWSPVLPTITSLTSASGPITGGTAVTISGAGFVQGATVNFVEESGGTPSQDNVVLPATNVTVNSSSSPQTITAVAPSITAGSTYFVTVTTPSGTTAYGSSSTDVFTYTSVPPQVTAIATPGTSPPGGSTAGGTAVTITGSGFVNGATVRFTPTSGGTATPATNVSVLSDTSIVAVSPGVVSAGSYSVTVKTPAGTSAAGSNVFAYSQLYPTVASISPTTGSHLGGVSVTITGTGFLTGSTVTFVQESGGNTTSPSVVLPATSVTVNGSTSITAVSPAITAGSPYTYFVQVTTSAGKSSFFPVFTYQ
jgi:hypothetical protein